jgi:molecular chaperone DnaK
MLQKKKKIETAIKSLEESLKSDNKEEIEAKTKELMESSQKLGEKIYAEQQAQQPNSNSAPQEEKTVDAEVVDAEFEEVKQDKQDK